MKYKRHLTEAETTLVYFRGGDVVMFTADLVEMQRLDGLCEAHPDVYKRVWADGLIMDDGKPAGVRYSFPRKFLKFARPRTAAQIESARTNLARANRPT